MNKTQDDHKSIEENVKDDYTDRKNKNIGIKLPVGLMQNFKSNNIINSI